MRRVLHVMLSLERSGMEIMLLNSSEEWCRHGYECDVLATQESVGPVASQIRESGYGVFHIPFRSKWRYLPRATFIREFYRLCKSGYDVVHIHSEAAPQIYAILAKLAGVRRIAVTPHSIFKFDGALRIRKSFERKIIRLLGGRFGMISDGVARCEWERFHNKGIRIWNWLDASHFRPPTEEERAVARRSLGIRDEFVIVSVGNCSYVKNHSALLHAIFQLPASIRPIYLHIGRDHVDFPERELAVHLKIENKVRFLGSQEDILPFLWASDVFAMPSLIEGFGISALEAIATGVPLVCSEVEGLLDIAAETKWTVLTSITPESIANGLARVAAVDRSEVRVRALSDSHLIRGKFSIQNGVRSIIEGLYA